MRRVEHVMGMPVSLLVRQEAPARAEAVFATLREADALFSPYRSDSLVCRRAAGEAVRHPLLRDVEHLCEQARVLTDGAFDARRPDGVWDPTGLVKAWAVERAARHLAGLDFCLNAGGDVHVEAPSGEPFRVGVQDPRDVREVVTVLARTGGGVATSGTAVRGAHLYDPLTGDTAAGPLAVTVVGPSLLWADVLATAAFVRGLGVLPPTYEALVVRPDGSRTVTQGWPNDLRVVCSPVQP